MAFNDCGNRDPRWQSGVGTGKSLSPDDLLLMANLYALGHALAGTPNPFVYNASKPLQSSGQYYCCLTQPTSGAQTASCARQF